MLSPSLTVLGPVFLMPRSLRVTTVSTESVSSAGVTVRGLMVAVLVILPVWMALTTMVIEAETCPGVRVPTLQVTTLLMESKLHWGLVALTKVVPAGMGSLKVALSKLMVPVFFTVTPYVMLPLRATVAGPVLSRDRSLRVTVVMTEELSSFGVSEGGPRAVL